MLAEHFLAFNVLYVSVSGVAFSFSLNFGTFVPFINTVDLAIKPNILLFPSKKY